MLNFKTFRLAALAGLTLAALPASAEHDSALIEALVRKGVLTTKEADAIRTDIAKEEKESSANKIKLSNSVTELKLYGDLRLRYQYDNKDQQLFVPARPDNRTPSGSQQSRWRFRLRLNADFRLTENFSGGVELQTSQAADSPNQTYQDGFNDYNIYISKAYLKWEPAEWIAITGGKFTNPFYTTDMLWDTDITPNGLSEAIHFHKLFSDGGGAAEAYSKDGKGVVAPPVAEKSPWEVSLVAGQFIFEDNNENAFDNDSSTDAYLFQTQLVLGYTASKAKITVAPGYFTYVNGSLAGLDNNNSFQDNANVSGATRNLNLLLFPGDVAFKIAGIKTKFYWDFSYNIEGRKRVNDIYDVFTLNNPGDPDDKSFRHSNQDNFAYLVGVQFGENKKKGDWSLLANWRQTGLGAVDPNLNDSDYAQGELNTRGWKLGLAYNLTDFAVGAVTWMHAWNLRGDLVGGEVTGGNAIGDANHIDTVQVDLSLKF